MRKRYGEKSNLVAMSSSSPPQPQYSLGKPFIFRYWSGVSAETPPKYWGYGRLRTKRPTMHFTNFEQPSLPTVPFALLKRQSRFPYFLTPFHCPPTCIQICSWQQQHGGVPGGRTHTGYDRFLGGGPHRVRTSSPILHHEGLPSPPRSAALPC